MEPAAAAAVRAYAAKTRDGRPVHRRARGHCTNALPSVEDCTPYEEMREAPPCAPASARLSPDGPATSAPRPCRIL
ncbi:hypothetical protein OG803_38165 [Streptomyces sp. NBC_00467]